MFPYFKRNWKILFLSLKKREKLFSICSSLFSKNLKILSSILKISMSRMNYREYKKFHQNEWNWHLRVASSFFCSNIRIISSLVLACTVRFRSDRSGQVRY